MPIYEYVCKKCNNSFEHLLMSQDSKPVVCPSCGSKSLGRLMSAGQIKVTSPDYYADDCASCDSGGCGMGGCGMGGMGGGMCGF